MGRSGTNSLWSSDKLSGSLRCFAVGRVGGSSAPLLRPANKPYLEEVKSFMGSDRTAIVSGVAAQVLPLRLLPCTLPLS